MSITSRIGNKFHKKHKPTYSLAQGKVDGLSLVGHYDFALLKYKQKDDYPYMLGLSMSGFAVNEALLPLEEGRAEIDAFEDELTSIVEHSTDSHYAGHSFWNGALETIFYIREYEALVKVLETEAKKKRNLRFTFKVDKDPEWSQLRSIYDLGQIDTDS